MNTVNLTKHAQQRILERLGGRSPEGARRQIEDAVEQAAERGALPKRPPQWMNRRRRTCANTRYVRVDVDGRRACAVTLAKEQQLVVVTVIVDGVSSRRAYPRCVPPPGVGVAPTARSKPRWARMPSPVCVRPQRCARQKAA